MGPGKLDRPLDGFSGQGLGFTAVMKGEGAPQRKSRRGCDRRERRKESVQTVKW